MNPWCNLPGQACDRYCDHGHELVRWHHDGGKRCFVCRSIGTVGYPPLAATRQADAYHTRFAEEER